MNLCSSQWIVLGICHSIEKLANEIVIVTVDDWSVICFLFPLVA
jgi:hypothetical protein